MGGLLDVSIASPRSLDGWLNVITGDDSGQDDAQVRRGYAEVRI